MYKLCSTEKSAAQQRQFEAAILPFLMQQPYDTITISELCRCAGYSRKVFYRLFEQKADVIYALIDHTLLDFENYQPDVSIVGQGEVHRFFAYWKEQKPLLDGLVASKTSSLLTEQAIMLILKEDNAILRSFGADSGRYATETIVFFISGLFALVLDWHKHGYDKSIDEMSQLLMTLFSTPPIKHPLDCDPCK